MAGTVLYAIGFPIYCIRTGSYIYVPSMTGKTSYELVIVKTFTRCLLTFLTWFFLHLFRKMYEDINLAKKTYERIEIEDHLLVYIYRLKNEIRTKKMTVDLDTMTNISFDENLREITITGNMTEKQIETSETDDYDNLFDENWISEAEEKTVRIKDYFTPSIYDTIKQYIYENVNLLMRLRI